MYNVRVHRAVVAVLQYCKYILVLRLLPASRVKVGLTKSHTVGKRKP